MNMPIAEINNRQAQAFAKAQVLPFVDNRKKSNACTIENLRNSHLNSSEILDQHFALQDGSHKDVKQYVVYFRHIMVFFADGSHCGLAQPKQFVALLGDTEMPESIVLKQNSAHVEIVLNARGNDTPARQAGSEVQIKYPSQETFTSKSGEDYFID
jgi:malate synthase